MPNIEHSTECVYRALASMATNYADTAREIQLGLTDVKLEDLTLPTLDNAKEWAAEFGCDGRCIPTFSYDVYLSSSVTNFPTLADAHDYALAYGAKEIVEVNAYTSAGVWVYKIKGRRSLELPVPYLTWLVYTGRIGK